MSPGIRIPLPDGPLVVTALVVDVNGTLARDGRLLPGVAEPARALAERVGIIIASGDTFGTAEAIARGLGVRWERIAPAGQGAQKRALVESLGPRRTAMVGNGRNDAPALALAALGICVIGPEGCAAEAAAAADVLAPSATVALGLLLNPRRLVATLRA